MKYSGEVLLRISKYEGKRRVEFGEKVEYTNYHEFHVCFCFFK